MRSSARHPFLGSGRRGREPAVDRPPGPMRCGYHSSAVAYFERLRMLAKDRRTQLCVGLDPDPERIDGGAAGALRHCREVVRQTEEHACCFKPNSAFWEQYGPDGWKALQELHQE